QMMFIVFGVISIYLPISAAKFFFLGSAAFALLPAEALSRALDVGGYPALRRNVASLSDRKSQFSAFRKSFKARHVLVLLVLSLLILPNTWIAIDAGIPYNSKSTYDLQVYDSLPAPLRVAPANASNFYLGAAGTQLDTPTQYDEGGYNWLAAQDVNIPAPQRPAFVSWWDYGFQAVAQGDHPTVADNFQNGIDPAGNFLLTQNESLAIGILATTLLQAEQHKTGLPYLPTTLNQILARDGVNLVELHTLLVNTSADVPLVIAHPERYLAVDASHLDSQNAMYDAVSWFLANTLPESTLSQVYNDIQSYTGWSIRYAMVDSRLFPFSGQSTGIFYAPADLTDRVIGSGGAPTAYYSLSVTGTDGNTYPVGAVPAGVGTAQVNINYTQAFYNSMIYRIFIGYTGAEVGSSGIPSLSGAAGGQTGASPLPIEPGWMLQHFEVVYRTAFYCPYPDPQNHPGCFRPTNVPEANLLAKKYNGTANTQAANYFNGGETMLAYYAGEPMVGAVTLPDGSPVGGARVTVFDSWGIPHMSVVTPTNGSFRLVLPPGNDTVNITVGGFDALHQQGTTLLRSFPVVVPGGRGYSFESPTLVQPVVLAPGKIAGMAFWNVGNNSTYIPKVDPPVIGAKIVIWGTGHVAATTETDPGGGFLFPRVAPGVYNISLITKGSNQTQPSPVYVKVGQQVNQSISVQPITLTGIVSLPNGKPANGATVLVNSLQFGPLVTATSNLTGAYRVFEVPPGNYTVSASASGGSLASVPAEFTVKNTSGKFSENITLEPVISVSLQVHSNGNPVADLPVRFTPITPLLPNSAVTPPAPNGSKGLPNPNGSAPSSSNANQSAATANSLVFLTGDDGFLHGVVPAANYSIYAL
ncbi:MAG: carboxypeptidase regulatory-like domain-containing protein, partial [Thermoplasmata archaeon]|nr:carboxypeptidase regulatory-like domain-containing protein [Thermoplasmata archaeon]